MSRNGQKIKERDLKGFKYFKAIPKLLEALQDVGCERDRAGNRLLHMDQYIALQLLYMFNPICVSLRSLQQASELKKVQEKLGIPRVSLGSLSEASTVFDSERMPEIIAQLGEKLEPIAPHAKLQDLPGILTAVDGTLLKALPKIAWALWLDDEHKAVKAHVHFEVLKAVPVKATITEGNGNEKDVLQANLEAGRIYALDRGYAKYALLQVIIDEGSSFVCRLREDCVHNVIEQRPVGQDALAAGVISDQIVWLGSESKDKDLAQPVRMIRVQCEPHPKRHQGGRGGPCQSDALVIGTDLLHLDADIIALIFQHRWSIELFFRFYKHILGCRHLLSHNRNGIELQTYTAIIACMLISLWTGRKPTLRTCEMLAWYFTGMADEGELLAHIERLQKAN